MNREEVLHKVFDYLRDYSNLSDGYFSEEDVLILSNLNYNDIHRNNIYDSNYFSNLCQNYFEVLRAKVYYFLVRLNLLKHDEYYFENKLLLDSFVPFKYDDLIVLKYVFKKNNLYDFYSYISLFITSGFDFAWGKTADLEKIKDDLNRYYNSQDISCYDCYKYVFRRHLSDVFTGDINEKISTLFKTTVNSSNFDYMLKLMGLAAEKKSFDLLSGTFNLKWVSKDYGDGYGFDFLVPRTSPSKEAGNLYEIKSSTKLNERLSCILTANESNVFKSTLREDSLYNYVLHLYDVKLENSRFLSFEDPLILFYDRLNKEVYDNHDIPYKIVQNDDGKIGFKDKLEDFKHLIYIKRD